MWNPSSFQCHIYLKADLECQDLDRFLLQNVPDGSTDENHFSRKTPHIPNKYKFGNDTYLSDSILTEPQFVLYKSSLDGVV